MKILNENSKIGLVIQQIEKILFDNEISIKSNADASNNALVFFCSGEEFQILDREYNTPGYEFPRTFDSEVFVKKE